MGDDKDEKKLHAIQKPRQWLMDRSNGNSQTQKEELGRPFCPLCWPPPCVKCCPDTLEQNCCCEGFGKIGVFPEDNAASRIWLMRHSILVHLSGLIMSILAALAITSNPDILQKFAFSSGKITGLVGDTNIQEVIMKVGLTSVYVKDYFFGERVYDFGELCTGTTIGIPLTNAEDCNACKDSSTGLVTTVIMGIVTYIPTIASNVNRSYYNYDVNCQKAFGTIVALFNMVLSLYTWAGYAGKCYGTFYDGDVTLPVLVPTGTNDTTIDPTPYVEFFQTLNETWLDENLGEDRSQWDFEEASALFYSANPNLFGNQTVELHVATVTFDWKQGTGLILVVVATFLKMIDIISHFLIRTPSITRDLQEQLEYEKLYGGDNEEGDIGGGDDGRDEDDDNDVGDESYDAKRVVNV